MTDHQWQQAFDAGRAEAEADMDAVVHALERCMLILDSLGQGPVYRDAREALIKYRAGQINR